MILSICYKRKVYVDLNINYMKIKTKVTIIQTVYIYTYIYLATVLVNVVNITRTFLIELSIERMCRPAQIVCRNAPLHRR